MTAYPGFSYRRNAVEDRSGPAEDTDGAKARLHPGPRLEGAVVADGDRTEDELLVLVGDHPQHDVAIHSLLDTLCFLQDLRDDCADALHIASAFTVWTR